MTIGIDLAGVLPGLQAQAESLMVDRCRVELADGEQAIDPETGAVTEAMITLAEDVPCKQQDNTLQPSSVSSAEGTVVTIRDEVHLPVPGRLGSVPVPEGAVVTIVESPREFTVGRRLRVLSPHRKTWQTAQRLPVEEVI